MEGGDGWIYIYRTRLEWASWELAEEKWKVCRVCDETAIWCNPWQFHDPPNLKIFCGGVIPTINDTVQWRKNDFCQPNIYNRFDVGFTFYFKGWLSCNSLPCALGWAPILRTWIMYFYFLRVLLFIPFPCVSFPFFSLWISMILVLWWFRDILVRYDYVGFLFFITL